MAQILDMGTDWKLIIDPNVNSIEEINKPEEGYVALIGENKDTGLHTISYVIYHKEYTDINGRLATRSVDDILKKVDDLKNCERCSTLDREKLNVDSIEFESPTSQGFVTPQPRQVVGVNHQLPNVNLDSPPPAKPPLVNDLFSNIIMDTLLTDPGKYFLGTFLGDKTLVDSAIKNKKPEEFAEEMFDFMEGKTDIVRSTDEAHDFLSMMRESKNQNVGTTKRKTGVSHGPRTVIY